jgi:hypothetical protein
VARPVRRPSVTLRRHCEPTGPARSGRPDGRLREVIQTDTSSTNDWIASSLRSSQ